MSSSSVSSAFATPDPEGKPLGISEKKMTRSNKGIKIPYINIERIKVLKRSREEKDTDRAEDSGDADTEGSNYNIKKPKGEKKEEEGKNIIQINSDWEEGESDCEKEEIEKVLDFKTTVKELEGALKKARKSAMLTKVFCNDKKNEIPSEIKNHVTNTDRRLELALSKLKNIELGVKIHVLKEEIKRRESSAVTQTTPSLRDRRRKKEWGDLETDGEEIRKAKKRLTKRRLGSRTKESNSETEDLEEVVYKHQTGTEGGKSSGKEVGTREEEWTTVERKKKVGSRKQREQKKKEGIIERTNKMEEQNKAEKEKRQKTLPKTEAIIVKTSEGGKTFAELFKQLKDTAGEKLQGIQMVRKSRGGDLILEMEKETSGSTLENVIKETLGENHSIKRMAPKVFYEVKDIDPSYEKEDFTVNLAENLHLNKSEIETKTFRFGYGGTKLAIISVPVKAFEILKEESKHKIGFTICKFKRTNNIIRCYKCHNFGHMSYTCSEKLQDQELCRRCGLYGHQIKQCEATRRCILCVKEGIPEAKAEHIAGSASCPQLKKYLQQYAERKTKNSI